MSCKVCSAPRREEIDRDLADGMGLREAARKYGISKSTLSHHRATCAVRELITATALEKIAEISDLVPLKSVKQLRTESTDSGADARQFHRRRHCGREAT